MIKAETRTVIPERLQAAPELMRLVLQAKTLFDLGVDPNKAACLTVEQAAQGVTPILTGNDLKPYFDSVISQAWLSPASFAEIDENIDRSLSDPEKLRSRVVQRVSYALEALFPDTIGVEEARFYAAQPTYKNDEGIIEPKAPLMFFADREALFERINTDREFMGLPPVDSI